MKEIDIEKQRLIYEIQTLKKAKTTMLDKLKDNLASIAALIAAVVAIGGDLCEVGRDYYKVISNRSKSRS